MKKFEFTAIFIVEADDIAHARARLDKELYYGSQHNNDNSPIVTYNILDDAEEVPTEEDGDPE